MCLLALVEACSSASSGGDTSKKSATPDAGDPDSALGKTPLDAGKTGAACGGQNHIACPNGQSCLSEVSTATAPKPMGTCEADDPGIDTGSSGDAVDDDGGTADDGAATEGGK